jgi:hypothetical protein
MLFHQRWGQWALARLGKLDFISNDIHTRINWHGGVDRDLEGRRGTVLSKTKVDESGWATIRPEWLL